MKSDKENITLKSYNSNYILNINSISYEQAIVDIDSKFSNDKLIKTINKINAANLDIVEIQRIKDHLKSAHSISFEEKEQKEVKKTKRVSKKEEDYIKKINKISKISLDTVEEVCDSSDYKTKIIKNNLRSGASIHYDGNILVIGDVNAGAELVATGNIIVLGIIRGLANAGAKGDKNVMVIANKINAVQLRIASLIAIPPKDDDKTTNGLQIASIEDDKIQIEQVK